jgi:hypothetical protein
MRPLGPTGCPQQRITDPTLLRVAGKAMLMPVQATLQGVLGGQLAFGIDIAAIDSNRGRAHSRARWTSANAAGKLGQCST